MTRDIPAFIPTASVITPNGINVQRCSKSSATLKKWPSLAQPKYLVHALATDTSIAEISLETAKEKGIKVLTKEMATWRGATSNGTSAHYILVNGQRTSEKKT